MRPMSLREMDALCYERGIEFDPAEVSAELHEMAQVIAGHPAWDGHSAMQELYEKRMAERRNTHRIPEWFSAEDVVWQPWERDRRCGYVRAEGAGVLHGGRRHAPRQETDASSPRHGSGARRSRRLLCSGAAARDDYLLPVDQTGSR
jgi:hypothetical protein